MNEESDRVLVERFQQGDREAYDELVQKYKNRIYEIAFGFTHHREVASDLTQEIFLRAFKALGDFKQKSTFYTWLYKIAQNVCIDYTRKRLRHQNVALDEGEALPAGQ